MKKANKGLLQHEFFKCFKGKKNDHFEILDFIKANNGKNMVPAYSMHLANNQVKNTKLWQNLEVYLNQINYFERQNV